MRLRSVTLLVASGLSLALAQLVHEQASVVEQLIARTTTTTQECNTPTHGSGAHSIGQPVLAEKPKVHEGHNKPASHPTPKPAHSGAVNHKHRHSSTSRPPSAAHDPSDQKPNVHPQKPKSGSPPAAEDKPSDPKPVATRPKSVVPKPGPPSSATSSDPFINDVLHAHNTYRWMHGEQALQWNTTLQAYAHDWASRCEWKHSDGNYGENLAEGYPDWAAKFAVQAWYDECKDYDFVHGKYDDEHGHCTQILWTDTTQVGCANVKCDNLVGGHIMSCSYYPAGNIVGDVDHQTAEDIKFFNAHLSPLVHH